MASPTRPDEPTAPGEIVRGAVDRYHDALTAYVARGGVDHLALVERMARRGAAWDGHPICPFLRPHFMARGQARRLFAAASAVCRALAKARQAAASDPELFDTLALTDGERRLAELGPDAGGVLTRLHAVLAGASFAFTDLQAEGASGVCYADRMSDLFEGFQPMREFAATVPVSAVAGGSALVGAVLDTWHEFGGTTVPRIAVVDWQEVATRTEFDLVCERFERHGVPARFVDPRELEYVDGELRAKGEGIDVVYRRALVSELLAREAEIRPFFEACRARVACLVNGFGAKVEGKRALFALLSDPRISALLTEEESAAVRDHVPWTRRLTEGFTEGPGGERIDLVPWALENRARLVLKPNDELPGRGARLGARHAPADWEQALRLALEEPSVIQLHVAPEAAMFPTLGEGGELGFERRSIEVRAHVFRGEAKGLSARLATATSAAPGPFDGAGAVPTFLLEER